jgi:hypothetical protein
VSVILLGVADAYAAYGLLVRPGSLPGARWAAIYVDLSWIVLSTLLGFVLLLTPTGSPPSPRWRWWARLVVAAAVVALTVRTSPLDPPYQSVRPGPVLVLVLGYAAVVLLGDRLLPEGSSLAVAATLAVAAAFSARLCEQVDLDTLSAELLAVTDQTMQPTTASLWLRARP